MRLTGQQAFTRLEGRVHGVLCTVHPDRGVDPVPVVYAVVAGHVGVPVDLVKPKASTHLQRERNLAGDPRAALLVEHWDPDDWVQLWWVRAELTWVAEPTAELVTALAAALADRVPQYRDQPFARVVVLRIDAVTGWTGAPSTA